MGGVKSLMIEEDERGYASSEDYICADCVSESALAVWTASSVASNKCSFCGMESDQDIAASFDDFVDRVLQGLDFEWNHPDDEGIMYNSREGGYQAPINDTYEVLYDYEISDDPKVIDALVASIRNDSWVEREFYRGNDTEVLIWGWDRFKDFVKHECRYFFLQSDNSDNSFGVEIEPSKMLDVISEIIRSNFEQSSLIRTLDTTTEIVRVRIDDKSHSNAGSIGTPPSEYATQSNRMSPSGVPMFYGALDYETAHAETFEEKTDVGKIISAGIFQPLRDLLVLDLTTIPDTPSVFESDKTKLIHPLRFLHSFAGDISKPIVRDDREHIEYVPTQIATEYFRKVFHLSHGASLDGIAYRSSKHDNGVALVIFCENDQCIDEITLTHKESLMRLCDVKHLMAE